MAEPVVQPADRGVGRGGAGAAAVAGLPGPVRGADPGGWVLRDRGAGAGGGGGAGGGPGGRAGGGDGGAGGGEPTNEPGAVGGGAH
ncbi:MAG: hypothetical protein EA378_03920 [Phycisphaerales bacterium]|nr:MAG: hypothetical protein EA378_03920 [Phycisphaerales bacterium]